MAKINLSDVKPGMVTSKPLLIQNRVILGEGVAITEKHIHLFKTWGVAFVEIAEDFVDGGQVESSLTPEERERLLKEIEQRFSLIKNPSSVMQEIRRITEKLILK